MEFHLGLLAPEQCLLEADLEAALVLQILKEVTEVLAQQEPVAAVVVEEETDLVEAHQAMAVAVAAPVGMQAQEVQEET
jgi:hypothetical protein